MTDGMDRKSLPDELLPVDITVMHRMFHNNTTLAHKFGFKFIAVANDALSEMRMA